MFKQYFGEITDNRQPGKVKHNLLEIIVMTICAVTVRRSGEKDRQPIHMVSAWAANQQMVLGQLATDKKSNEITAVQELLEMLDIGGCIITADAMNCRKAIVKKIVEKGADYALSLKGNQSILCAEVREYFEAAEKQPKEYHDVTHIKTTDQGHGRIETRKYYITTNVDWYENKQDWKNLRSFGMVVSKVEQRGKTTTDTRYFISSLEDINVLADAVRKHWGIENSLHWCLDMTFHKDYSRIRKDHSAENMAVVRHIALNILKSYPEKISLARKHRRCSCDDIFFAKVMCSVRAFHA